MQHLQENPHLLCSSCGEDLGFIKRNVNVAQFLNCKECDRAQKFHPDYAFLQNWDKDIFLEPFADFTLEGSDGGIVRAHKAILAGKSKVFKTMLMVGMSETVSGKVKISDMTAGELDPLMNFLYTGRVKQRSLECHAVALYRASHKYDLPLLTAICQHFLENNVIRDIRGVFELAVDHEVEKFQKAVLPFIFSEGFIESNPPALVMKTLRTASKFDCFALYRKKNFEAVSFLMEFAVYRVADHLYSDKFGCAQKVQPTTNVNVAQFLYSDESDKLHPYRDFLQNWDNDIFREPFVDFTLEGSDGGIVRAHKAVLAGKSKVFKTMLRAGMSESISGKAKISDMTSEELHPLIDFLYTGRVKQRSLDCHGVALYRASHKYDLPILTSICEYFLERNVIRDVRGVFELAITHGAEKLQKAVLPFIFTQVYIESNPPSLLSKTLRAASKFECFAEYRKNNSQAISSLMEIAFYRVADHLDDPHKRGEEGNKFVPVQTMATCTSSSSDRFCFSSTPVKRGGHQTISNPPEVVASSAPLSVVSKKPLNRDSNPLGLHGLKRTLDVRDS